jgi:cupin fold WbuC family metalloprotein
MPLLERNPEVLVADGPLLALSGAELDDLVARVPAAPRGRVRICAHQTDDAALHEMIIAMAGGRYIRPHRHRGKAESFHLIRGEVDIVFFDEDGAIATVLPMTDRPGGLFYYRIADAIYHTLVVRSAAAVYHEVTTGPFKREDTEFAPWAPPEGDAEADAWLRDLNARLHARTAHADGR